MTDPFVGQWKITDCEVKGDKGSIPMDTFVVGTLLTISEAASKGCYDLDWPGGHIENLPLVDGQLEALIIPVTFRQGGTVGCCVTVGLDTSDPRKSPLTGTLSIPGDGNTGTFAADAHPGTTEPG